jgi:hypothetical protein
MRLHKFNCGEEHVFFMPLNLPIDIRDFVQMSKNMMCPICQSREIDIHALEYEIKEVHQQ